MPLQLVTPCSVYLFFFQAEDGIRDFHVTGVQTCALPIALEDAHRFGDARQVLLAGRRALGRPAAFGIELAELLERVGEWEGAAREWGAALTEAPTQLPNAASSLAEAPAERRERIGRAVLATEPTPLERRLAGELLLGWGEPQRAWTVFEPTAS